MSGRQEETSIGAHTCVVFPLVFLDGFEWLVPGRFGPVDLHVPFQLTFLRSFVLTVSTLIWFFPSVLAFVRLQLRGALRDFPTDITRVAFVHFYVLLHSR